MDPSLASSPSHVRQLQQEFDAHMQAFFHERRERLDYGDFFEPLYLHLGELINRPAKRVRPLMLMAAHDIFGGCAVPRASLLDTAAALELLHSFILIQDDVIDRSDLRRGYPTYHKLVESSLRQHADRARLGQNIAVVMGDIVFALAMDTMQAAEMPAETRRRVMRRFLGGVLDTGAGEIHDILLGTRDISRAPREEIERMYELKTTRYTIQMPLEIGAIMADASEAAVMSIARFAAPFGLAFQMLNDLAEFLKVDEFGVAFSSDLVEGKKTLLIRAAFERLEEPDKSLFQISLSNPAPSEAAIIKVSELIRKSGAEEALRRRAEELFTVAENELMSGDFTPGQRDGLRGWCAFVQNLIRV